MSHVTIPIIVDITVPDIKTTLLSFDRIQVQRSTNGAAGAWEDITEADTEIRLVQNANRYVWTDPEGAPSYFYRYRFWNSTTSVGDAYSTPALGQQDGALLVLSVQELKDFYLFGVDLSDDTNTPFPDALFHHYIRGALDWFEHKFDICIKPQVFTRELHDYYKADYENFTFLEVDHFPVISVESVRLRLPGSSTPTTYPKDWLRLERESGTLHIIPTTGAGLLSLGQSRVAMSRHDFLPQVFEIDYTAGFGYPPAGSYNFAPGSEPPSISNPNPKLDQVPPIIKELVGKVASFGPLNIAGDLVVGAGLQAASVNMDGLGQSITTTNSSTNAGFGARLLQYQKEIKDQIPTLLRYYKGLRLRVA